MNRINRIDRIAKRVVGGKMTLSDFIISIAHLNYELQNTDGDDPKYAEIIKKSVELCKDYIKNREEAVVPEKKKSGKIKWGFDLTDISALNFVRVLQSVGMGTGEKGTLTDKGWVWKGSGIEIVTGNNPITGEYMNGGREDEIGYASYIGIEGDADKVTAVVREIKKRAKYIKGESKNGREFI